MVADFEPASAGLHLDGGRTVTRGGNEFQEAHSPSRPTLGGVYRAAHRLSASIGNDNMDFELTDVQRRMVDVVRAFAEKEVAPRAAEIDRSDEWPRDLYRRLAELGLLGMMLPAEYGGSGGGYGDVDVVSGGAGAALRRRWRIRSCCAR